MSQITNISSTFSKYCTGGYEYAFNGKEKDDEVSGTGNQYDYGFRIYNPRIGKFLSVDPLTKSYPWYTPYQFAGNKPIIAIDLDGLEELIVIRWFDGDKFIGETLFRVHNYYDRQKGQHAENTMQIMNLKIDYKKAIISRLDGTKSLNGVEKYIKNKDGSFKGDYYSTVPLCYKNDLTYIRQVDSKEGINEMCIMNYRIETKSVLFKYNSDEFLNKKSNETLLIIKDMMEKNPDYKLNITATSSSENKTGKPDYNLELSQKRADAVKSYFIKNGISPDRIISSEGKGETNSYGDSNTNEGLANNRQAQIDIIIRNK